MKMKEEVDNKTKLYQKILEVKREVVYLQKAAQGKQYDYVSSSQVLSAVNTKMNEIGLIFTTAIVNTRMTPFETTNGSSQFMTELDMIMTWVDVDTGFELALPFYAQGVDTGEKGVGKACTYGEKYFLLKQLNVATDKDDPDFFQEKTMNARKSKEDKDKEIGDRFSKLIPFIEKAVKDKDIKSVTKIWNDNKDMKDFSPFVDAISAAGAKIKEATK